MGIIKKILDRFFRKEEMSIIDSFFFSLSPTDHIENGQHYFDALKWALSNRKEENIKNIALTGPYGSGKSSILQSFQKDNTDRNLHFLNISLATFKEEKENNDKTKDKKLQRLIELSILQQLFYREKDHKLPDSRLKKITNFSLQRLLSYALCSVIFIISLVLVFKPQILTAILPQITISENIKTLIHYISLCFSIIGIFFVTLKSIRILHNLKISKLNIQNTEIEINPEINKSVLNHNLEEILYFFEVMPYNVVIIEDLDRFQETEIFTKLREVNLLINNSKKINKDVVFIYAVRDEMFTDKDRTKFFDFIIPVIPIINASNSNEILLKEIKAIDGNMSDTLIDDISLFIDEMRVLFNIVNEFQIYRNLLSDKLNPDKLLAMVVYKNICPCDFVKLSNYEGDLYNTINKKHEYIKQQLEVIEREISEYKEKLKRLEELKITDINELRSLYILQYIKHITSNNNNSYGFSYFVFNDQKYNLDQIIDDNMFPYLCENKIIYYCGRQGYGNHSLQIRFQDIEKQVDSKYTYNEREQQIKDWNNDKGQELKQKISALEQKKNKLRQTRINKLLSEKNISAELNDNKQKLINTLLRNGYIAEDYLDYISLFHEGSLSRNDFTFLLNVKSQTNTDFSHPLDHIENLIKRIHIDDFGNEYILNYKLVNFILANDGNEKQKNAIFTLLKNESSRSIAFIFDFIEMEGVLDFFLLNLCHYWDNIWNYIVKGDVEIVQAYNYFTDDKVDIYFKLIIENADTTDIKAISDKSNLKQYIAEQKEFCSIISDKERTKRVLKTLDIKFDDLELSITPDDLLDYIYQNNHYKINSLILKKMIQAKGNFNQVDFDTRNYYAIKNSNCDALIKYIEDNINDYITNVYLKLETNTKEDENCLIELLNNDKITEKDKTAIIKKVETKISDLSKIDLLDIENRLLQYSKVKPAWENLIENFVNAENEMSEFIVEFFNNNENAEILSKTQIEEEKPDKETVDKFLMAFLLNEKINNDSYALILYSVPYIYLSLSFENLSEEKVKILIDKNKLELTEKNYAKLTENFENLHIFLIEKRHWKLSEIINSLAFDEKDICASLKSSVLPYKIKEEILNYYGDTDIISNSDILDLIGDILLKQSTFKINKEVKKAILTNSKLTTENKILLFNNLNEIFDKNDITTVLQSLPESYANIAENGKRPNLSQNAVNANFVKILKDRKYISDFKSEKKGIRISTFRK